MSVQTVAVGLLAFAELASIIGIVGCASPRLRLDANVEPPGTSYKAAYARWTREATAVAWQDLDTTLLVSATLRSRAFQRAYIDRYLHTYSIKDPAERSRIETAEMQLAESGLNFWVRTATHDAKWNDLTPQRGRWRIALLVEPKDTVEEVLPLEVTAVGRGEGLETALFDETPDVYRRIWRLRFPPLPASATGVGCTTGKPCKLILRFVGPVGKTDLVWHLE